MDHQLETEIFDRRVRRTRRAIREAITRLLAKTGAEQITIKDIAGEADIGYTTFFRHFQTKEAALADLANAAASELIGGSLPLIQTRDSRAACAALCAHVEGHRAVWTALLTGGVSQAVRDALLVQTLDRSMEWPKESAWLPAEAGAALATGLVVETLTWWLSKAPGLDAENVAEIMDRLFISALVEGAGQGRAV